MLIEQRKQPDRNRNHLGRICYPIGPNRTNHNVEKLHGIGLAQLLARTPDSGPGTRRGENVFDRSHFNTKIFALPHRIITLADVWVANICHRSKSARGAPPPPPPFSQTNYPKYGCALDFWLHLRCFK